MEVGKLYACEEYHLMLYPDQETAAAAYAAVAAELTAAARASVASAVAAAAYWSNQLGKPVSYTEKNIPILVLNNEEEYVEVLAGDKKGWIIYIDWLNFKEVE